MEDSLFFILKIYLRKQGFKLNWDELKFQLFGHPSYPSLHSLTGVLTHLGIDNLALEVPQDMESLEHMPKSFISLTKLNQFAFVNREGDDFQVITSNREGRRQNANEFIDNWRGIVVVAEIPEDIEKTSGNLKEIQLKTVVYLMTLLVMIIFFLLSESTWFQIIYVALLVAGIFVSTLIVKHELGFKSKIVNNICNGNKSISCDAVLNSKGVLIFKSLKLSDLCMMYFFGLLFITFIGDVSTIIVYGITVLVLPITLYSIYYQSAIVKKWCPLCLIIVGILWLQFLVFFISELSFYNIVWDFYDFTTVIMGFLLSISSWLFVRRLLKGEQELFKLKIEHHKFKRNFDLFSSVLNKKPILRTVIQEIQQNEIVLGNKTAPLSIILVTSPGCFYCRQAHTDLESILEKNADSIKLIIRFNVSSKEKESLAYRVAARLLEFNEHENIETTRKALQEAYAVDSDLESWLVKWGDLTTRVYDSILLTQKKWCHANEINFTPALYINGKEFPSEYNREDLSFFIEDLLAQAEEHLYITSAETSLK